MVFFLFQEKDQDKAVCDSNDSEPMESRFPTVCPRNGGAETTQRLSRIEPGHMDPDG